MVWLYIKFAPGVYDRTRLKREDCWVRTFLSLCLEYARVYSEKGGQIQMGFLHTPACADQTRTAGLSSRDAAVTLLHVSHPLSTGLVLLW